MQCHNILFPMPILCDQLTVRLGSARVATLLKERRKTLGSFFTPTHLASGLANWAIRSKSDHVLDPAAGEAVFLVSALERLQALGSTSEASQVVGIEIDPGSLRNAQSVLAARGLSCRLDQANFFSVNPKHLNNPFDAIVGNPPYVRYHRFRGAARRLAINAAAESGVHLSHLASSWAPFVVHATRFLNPRGRLALVLPAELLHVDYAAPIREFLTRRFTSVTVITFERAVFPGAMVDTVLLLADNASTACGLRVLALSDASDFQGPLSGAFAEPIGRWSRLRAPVDGVRLLEQLRNEKKLQALSAVASVDIGMVTGANNFFILNSNEAKTLNLRATSSMLTPVITRPANLPGAILRDADLHTLSSEGGKYLLLNLTRSGLEATSTPLARYLRKGRRLGIANRYKCRVRSPWYSVPSVRVPDAFLSYMSHRVPRVALNRARVGSTNLVHNVTFKPSHRANSAAYVAALHSSIALLSFEIEGRSYGGGVLKLETKEAERVELPTMTDRLSQDLASLLPEIDRAVRRGDLATATDWVDETMVSNGLIDLSAIDTLRKTRNTLLERRLVRGRTTV